MAPTQDNYALYTYFQACISINSCFCASILIRFVSYESPHYYINRLSVNLLNITILGMKSVTKLVYPNQINERTNRFLICI